MLVDGISDPPAAQAEAGSWKGLPRCLTYLSLVQAEIKVGTPVDGTSSTKAGHVLTFVLRTIWTPADGTT